MPQFTEKAIKALKPGETRRIVWSGDPGFGLRVYPSGRKSWVYQFRMDGRPSRMITLGRCPRMSLADARQAVEAAKDAVEHGTDPADAHMAEKAAERAAMTVKALMDEYIELWAKPRKRSWKEDERMILHDILPKWGGRKAKDIKRHDVVTLLDSIVARPAPITANRVLSLIHKVFKFSIQRGMLQINPCAGLIKPSPERRKNHVLTGPEIARFWNGLGNDMTPTTEAVLKTILATGQRPGEVAGMHTDELDADWQWWTIPAERAKNKRLHRVPLTDLTRKLIAYEVWTRATPCYVFASKKPGCHVTTNGVASALKRNCKSIGIPPTTPHDLRRTFATEGGAIGIPREHRARILNHTDGDVTAIYDRYGYDAEKRTALEMWWAHILKLTGNGEKI